MPSSLRRGLLGEVGRARNHVNSIGFRYPPRSGGAALEGREGHETMYIIWVSDTLLAHAGPPWRGGRSTKPCK
eukprot:6579187-Pyramimonas_sp.AAC.1